MLNDTRIVKRTLTLSLVATVLLGCEGVIFTPRRPSDDPLYSFVQNRKAGYIDNRGQVVIPPTWQHWGYEPEFHNGLLYLDGQYVNATGKVVIDGVSGTDFSEGLAAVARKGETLWGYIDATGQFAISPRFGWGADSSVSSFSDGLARIETNGKSGFIDHSAVFVIKPQFLEASDFSDGRARVVAEGPCAYLPHTPCANVRVLGADARGEVPECKFAFIDKTGRIISPLRFDDAGDFSEGLAAVKIGALWGYLDKSGQLVIPAQFQYAGAFSSGRAPVAVDEEGAFGYIDEHGNIAIDPRFDEAESFSDGLAVVSDKGERYWYIDPHGRKAIAEDFATASPFFKGLAQVELISNDDVNRYAYIDHAGRHLFTYIGRR